MFLTCRSTRIRRPGCGELRRETGLAAEKSFTDFALCGAAGAGICIALEQLAERGVIGFKAFMSNSGIEDFSSVDEATFARRDEMKRSQTGENWWRFMPRARSSPANCPSGMLAKNRTPSATIWIRVRSTRSWMRSTKRSNWRAKRSALHIVHVSSGGGGVDGERTEAGRGCDVRDVPALPVLTEEDVENRRVAKCAPPLRTKSAQEVLWRYVENGYVSTIGSDPLHLRRT